MPEPEASASPRRAWRGLWWGVVALGAVAALAAFGWPWARVTRLLTASRQVLRAGDPATALDLLQTAQRIQPRRPEVQYLLAVASRRAGRLDRFESHLGQAEALGWTLEEIARQRALAAAQSGDVAAVQQPLTEAIEQGAPDDVAEEIYEAFAKGHLAAYRLREAWICLDAWLQWKPQAPQARLMRAYLYEQMNNWRAAADDYQAALEQLPDSGEARVKLARALLTQNLVEEARSHYRARLEVAPDDPDALVGLVRCESKLGQAQAVRQAVEAALAADLSPYARGIVLGEWGRLLLADGKTDEALAVLEQAAVLAPGETQVHAALATALARAGQPERSKRHQQRARQIREEYDRITEIGRKLVERPDDADLRYQTGEILMRQGLRDEGVRWLRSALVCDPHHRKTHAALAQYYAEIGDHERAAEHRLEAAG
ncbi:MAG: tetratricopeptide repeat protein, partial [Thermoguttaceae bacterium]|nr:tetratricopeptide repeat protein [Thermoguttaceae bacterium]